MQKVLGLQINRATYYSGLGIFMDFLIPPDIKVNVKVKIKLTLEQTTKAQR